MKVYNVSFKLLVDKKNFRKIKYEPQVEQVEASSFKEARNTIREKYSYKAKNIKVVEVK